MTQAFYVFEKKATNNYALSKKIMSGIILL